MHKHEKLSKKEGLRALLRDQQAEASLRAKTCLSFFFAALVQYRHGFIEYLLRPGDGRFAHLKIRTGPTQLVNVKTNASRIGFASA